MSTHILFNSKLNLRINHTDIEMIVSGPKSPFEMSYCYINLHCFKLQFQDVLK